MIQHLYGNNQWITVTNSTSVPYISPGAQSAGMVRWNGSMNRTEVYDGISWVSLGGDAHLDLSEQAKQALAWAKGKMAEEQQLKELMAQHPALQELHDKFEMMKLLVSEQAKHGV